MAHQPTPSLELFFGTDRADIDTIAQELAGAFSAPFEERDSSYLGDYYLARDLAPFAKGARLYVNRDPIDGRVIRPSTENFTLVLEVHAVLDAAGLGRTLAPFGLSAFTPD